MNLEISNEVIKILSEKRILIRDGNDVSFSDSFFFDTIMKCINNVEKGKKTLKVKTFDDIMFQSTNNAISLWNLNLGLNLSDAEYEEECITCWALMKVKYLDSIKSLVRQDIQLCAMLEKDRIRIN